MPKEEDNDLLPVETYSDDVYVVVSSALAKVKESMWQDNYYWTKKPEEEKDNN
jgi:hypothetical protein